MIRLADASKLLDRIVEFFKAFGGSMSFFTDIKRYLKLLRAQRTTLMEKLEALVNEEAKENSEHKQVCNAMVWLLLRAECTSESGICATLHMFGASAEIFLRQGHVGRAAAELRQGVQ